MNAQQKVSPQHLPDKRPVTRGSTSQAASQAARSAAKAGISQAAPQGSGKQPAKTVYYSRATYQDVLDAPPNRVAEIVGGRLHTLPRPAPLHAQAGVSLGTTINGSFGPNTDEPGGWIIQYEPELHFNVPLRALTNDAGNGNDPATDNATQLEVLVPDWAGWRRERLPILPLTAYFTIAPDWVCEILSPSTRHLDLGAKRAAYAREGVPYLWLVDPEARSLEAFELQEGTWVSLACLTEDAMVSLPPFEAIRFPLSELWWR